MKLSASDPLDSLVDLACRDGVDIRPTLLRVLTDLYVQKPIHCLEEKTQYVELALVLIDSVDATTRAAAVNRLSAYPAAPAAILHKLANGPSPATSAGEAPEGSDLIELFLSAPPQEGRRVLGNLDVAGATATRRAVPAAGEMVRRLENA